MAGEEVTQSTIEKLVLAKIEANIGKQDGWSDGERQRITDKYMEEYNAVLSEMVPLIEQHILKPISEHPQPSGQSKAEAKEGGSQEAQEEEEYESLEDLEIRYEGTLLAVTKKRREYPTYLAGLLGKSTRLQKNALEAMKVTLPPQAGLEMGEGADQVYEQIKGLMEETVPALSHSCLCIQEYTKNLKHLAHAAQVVQNNHHHPIETLLSTCTKHYAQSSNRSVDPFTH